MAKITSADWVKAANEADDPEIRDYYLRYAQYVESEYPDGYEVDDG